jgi:hypothetical protein
MMQSTDYVSLKLLIDWSIELLTSLLTDIISLSVCQSTIGSPVQDICDSLVNHGVEWLYPINLVVFSDSIQL